MGSIYVCVHYCTYCLLYKTEMRTERHGANWRARSSIHLIVNTSDF